jgi:lipoyl(octanoyl) transferase
MSSPSTSLRTGSVETSLDISGRSHNTNNKRFLDSARNDKEENANSPIFAALKIYHDIDSRSAALNMAIDEALLEIATEPLVRFYRWDHPALSFGYFGRFADVENFLSERDMVRRWTGGGTVFHGDDLTYTLVIPASDLAFAESSLSIYETVHRAICDAFNLARKGDFQIAPAVENRRSLNPAPTERGDSECFLNPVRADVLLDGRKIAGAAQRRTRRGLLHQGSIQNTDVPDDFDKRFVAQLSRNSLERQLDNSVLHRAQQLAVEKYATAVWLRRR